MKIDWKKILGTVAPVLATAAGGPLAGVVTKTLAAGLLERPDASQEEVEQAVANASPETLIKLKEIDAKFQNDMAQVGIDFEKIASEDRANARAREVSSGDHWTPRILAAVIVTGYFAVQWYILSHAVPVEQREIVMRSMGVLDTALGLTLGYYFGSSSGSKLKTEALARAR